MKISVVICTHNPRVDYLHRVLTALKAQTLPKEQWELLLVDNASMEPLADKWDLSWHPHAGHIREEKVGKTYAILTAIGSARGDLFLTVDDDNVLDADFLLQTIKIAEEFPHLGAWGANIEGEFEQEVPDWLKSHVNALAVRKLDKDYWSNYFVDTRSMPAGAGLCVRKIVADAYAHALISRPKSKKLGRTGSSLDSCEDTDLAMTSYDCRMGTGMFQRLRLTHIIPKRRMTVDYMCQLLEGIEYSTHILRNQRDSNYFPHQASTFLTWLTAYQIWRLPEPIRSFAKAQKRGIAKAKFEIISKSNIA